MNTAPIDMTYFDHHRLSELIDRVSAEDRFHFPDLNHYQALRQKLETAHYVDSAEISPRVVTMGSTVRLRELDGGEWWTFTLCYPNEARIDEDRISVLAPVGTAILGQRVGDVVDWPVPRGTVRIRISRMLYQPEAAGLHDEPELVLQ